MLMNAVSFPRAVFSSGIPPDLYSALTCLMPRFVWQTAISQAARTVEIHHSLDRQFYPTGQNHFLSVNAGSPKEPGWPYIMNEREMKGVTVRLSNTLHFFFFVGLQPKSMGGAFSPGHKLIKRGVDRLLFRRQSRVCSVPRASSEQGHSMTDSRVVS